MWLIPHLGRLREFIKTDIVVANLNFRIEIATESTAQTGVIQSRGIYWLGEVLTINEPTGEEEGVDFNMHIKKMSVLLLLQEKYGIPDLQRQPNYANHKFAKSIAVCTPSMYIETEAVPVDVSSGPAMMV